MRESYRTALASNKQPATQVFKLSVGFTRADHFVGVLILNTGLTMIDDLIGMSPNLPPPAVDDLARISPATSRLAIHGKTRNLDQLARLTSLEAVWVADIADAQFTKIAPLIDPLYLAFEGMRVSDLSPLGKLRLQALEIKWNTKVSDISPIGNLRDLRLLAISHCPKVHDLSPLRALTRLEVLDLSGGMWSTFKPLSLEPLANLSNLRGLSLKNIRVGDQSLEPLVGLKQLRHLELSNQFPTEEYARLSVALPSTECTHFSPYLDFFSPDRKTRVLVTGKGKPVLTLPEDTTKLNRYVQRFRDLQEHFRSIY
jgi:hypothetical protein